MAPSSEPTCTGAAQVASLPAPTKDHVDATWLSAALGLPAAAVVSVAVRPFVGGFSPIIKARLDVTYSASASETGTPAREPSVGSDGIADWDRPRALFMKLLPADTSAMPHLCAALLAMVKQAHRVEAAFYTLAMTILSPSAAGNQVTETPARTCNLSRSGHTALRAVVPRAYHANGEQAILLADTVTSGYEPLSAWSVELTEGPHVEWDALVAIVRALAVVHTADVANLGRTLEGDAVTETAAAAADGGVGAAGAAAVEIVPPPGPADLFKDLLTWDALIESRAARIMLPVGHSADKLAALMLDFGARFCLDDAKPGLPLHALCTAAARVSYSALMRAITPVSGGILHGDPNPGNVLYDKERRQALLVDFQDTAAAAPGVVDVARLLLSGLQPDSRKKLEDGVVRTYLQAYQHQQLQQQQGKGIAADTAPFPHPETPNPEASQLPEPLPPSFRKDLLLALLGDAMLIMASVAFSLETRGPALFYALGERSIICLRDHCEEMLGIVQELSVMGSPNQE